MAPIYRLRNVVKSRVVAGAGFRLLVSKVEIGAGEQVALIGPSGCGKSTLLDLLAMVLQPSQAEVFDFAPGGAEPTDLRRVWARHGQNRLSELRSRNIGYVLQTGGLLPYLTVRENIRLSRRLLGMPNDDTVSSLARVLGIHRQLDKLPGNLSAGERQRAAFARALAHRPSIIIADEPTAALDPITARKIMAVVMELVKGLGITMIIASHDWANVYKMDLRSLHHRSRTCDNGAVVESVFSD